MDKKEFKGELRYIDSSRIIKEGKDDLVANFFLVLAVIYNDLKGIVLFEKLILDTYRRPDNTELSVHAGEFGGLLIQARKNFIANISEFLIFLQKNEEVLLSSEFNDVLSKTSKEIQLRWKDIVNVSYGRIPNVSEFNNYLILIRNNVVSHYNWSGVELRKSFCNYFFKREKIPRNIKAYYCEGGNMEGTRFFYADAAVEEYLRSIHGGIEKGFDMKFTKEIPIMIEGMNFTIMKLLKAYLKNRPK